MQDIAKKLNFFPPKSGVSSHYSPHAIMHHQVIDYNRHCKYTHGSYVQAHDDPPNKNNMKPCTLDCIYLHALIDNVQGGHRLLNSSTGEAITRPRVTELPITALVKRRVHAIAKKEKMKSWKVQSTESDDSSLAEVEYNQNPYDDDENYDSDYEDSENEDETLSYDSDENEDESSVSSYESWTHVDRDEDVSEDEMDEDSDESNNTDEDSAAEEDEEEQPTVRTSTRSNMGVPESRYEPSMKGQSYAQYEPEQEHELISKIMAKTIEKLCFVETFTLKQAIKKYGDKGEKSGVKEMKQLHDRMTFHPRKKEDLTEEEIDKAMQSLLFFVEKRDGTIKGRHCANGSTQRTYMEKGESTSPTASADAILLTAIVEAEEERDVTTIDIPNAFIQTELPKVVKGERVMMKLAGEVVDLLLTIDCKRYAPFVIYEKGKKVLYVEILRAIYGMLNSAILFYKKWRKDVESCGFKVNDYEPCVANKKINGKWLTITWHVDDLKASHKDTKVVDWFIEWVDNKYGDDKMGRVTAHRGKKHDYLAMVLDYSEKGKVKIDMTDYVQKMITQYEEVYGQLPSKEVKSVASANLFNVDKHSKDLEGRKAEDFHTITAKGPFVSKRARPDIQPPVAYLCTRVSKPTESDWKKMARMLTFMKQTKKDVLTLESDGTGVITWGADASFAVHPDMKSHTGYGMTMGKGYLQTTSRKQKLNTRSSTEAELVAADDAMTQILWTKMFLEGQGYVVRETVLLQDNTSAIQLENNGKWSSHKRTRHINIRCFFITDQIEKGILKVKYCSTDNMAIDYMSKPLQGEKSTIFRREIMNLCDE